MHSLTTCIADMARFVDSVPFFMSWRELSISVLVSSAASADLAARPRTSSDTTAKPLPAVPARAASMESRPN